MLANSDSGGSLLRGLAARSGPTLLTPFNLRYSRGLISKDSTLGVGL